MKYTKNTEVTLFAFAYRLFHEDFSPIYGVMKYIGVMKQMVLTKSGKPDQSS